MRILYGVVGEGMGHATRSRVVLEHLLKQGHELCVVVSGNAHSFLVDALKSYDGAQVHEIVGLRLVQDVDGVDRSASLWANVAGAPKALRHNIDVYRRVANAFNAEAVVSDFESWAYYYGRTYDLPVISLDNIQVLHRCRHRDEISGLASFNFFLARWSAKAKMPKAYHFLVSSFFFPPVRKERTTLVPPILRPEVLAAVRTPGEHVLVYQHAAALEALLPALRAQSDVRFKVYGLGARSAEANLDFCPFSQTGFIDDLSSARAAIAGGGFSLMCECVHLGVPLLSVPLGDQFEQELNARYLESLGYGMWTRALNAAVMVDFLSRISEFQVALRGYVRRDNAMTLRCLDHLLERVALREPPAAVLEVPNLGDMAGPPL